MKHTVERFAAYLTVPSTTDANSDIAIAALQNHSFQLRSRECGKLPSYQGLLRAGSNTVHDALKAPQNIAATSFLFFLAHQAFTIRDARPREKA
jgi:hypothetical protein